VHWITGEGGFPIQIALEALSNFTDEVTPDFIENAAGPDAAREPSAKEAWLCKGRPLFLSRSLFWQNADRAAPKLAFFGRNPPKTLNLTVQTQQAFPRGAHRNVTRTRKVERNNIARRKGENISPTYCIIMGKIR
jgi:hypothetical protein